MKTRKRSRKADVVLSVIVLLLVTFGFTLSHDHTLDKRAAARVAVAAASQTHAFREDIGLEPRIDWPVHADMWKGSDEGTARLSVPVSGKKGRGTLIAWVEYHSSPGWFVCEIDLRLDNGEDVDLKPIRTIPCDGTQRN